MWMLSEEKAKRLRAKGYNYDGVRKCLEVNSPRIN